MNLPPLFNHWKDETITFDGAELTSFDIWGGGLRTDDRATTQFKEKDFQYMTLVYSTKDVPVEYVWRCLHLF